MRCIFQHNIIFYKLKKIGELILKKKFRQILKLISKK